MTRRADKYTVERKKVEYYSDIPTNLDRNPLTGFVARVTNEDAVKMSVRNLVLTHLTSRFYQPFVGCKISRLMFEPMDTITAGDLSQEIATTLRNNEPRVFNVQVEVTPDPDKNIYYINVFFEISGIVGETYSVEIVKRVR